MGKGGEEKRERGREGERKWEDKREEGREREGRRGSWDWNSKSHIMNNIDFKILP